MEYLLLREFTIFTNQGMQKSYYSDYMQYPILREHGILILSKSLPSILALSLSIL